MQNNMLIHFKSRNFAICPTMAICNFSLLPSGEWSAVCSEELEEVRAHLHIEEEERHGCSEGESRCK